MNVKNEDIRTNENPDRRSRPVQVSSTMLILQPRRVRPQNAQIENDVASPRASRSSLMISNGAVAKRVTASKRTRAGSLRIPRLVPCSFMTTLSEVLEVPPNVCDIDLKTDDLQYDKNYAKEIMLYVKELEMRRRLPEDYLEGKMVSLNPQTRSILVDWLIQVQHYLKLNQETLYLTTNIFDHFCVKKDTIAPERLQLIILSCLFIACKLEERYLPELPVLVHLSDDTCTTENILKMEQIILTTLKFELVMPDPMVFLNRCLQTTRQQNTMLEHLSTFLIDVNLPDIKVLKILPSKLVAAAHCLARKLLLRGEDACWNRTLEYYSGYTKENISDVMLMIADTVMEAPGSPNQGAMKKYSSKRRYQALSESQFLKPAALELTLADWSSTD